MRCLLRHRRILITGFNIAVTTFALVLAYMLRFDFRLPDAEVPSLKEAIWILLVAKIPVFRLAKIDRGWLRFVSFADLYYLVLANVIGTALFTAMSLVIIGPRFPRSVYCIDFVLCFLLTSGGRCSVRLYRDLRSSGLYRSGGRAILIYGAGVAGMALLRDLRSTRALGYRVIGFLDDDRAKLNFSFMGVRVLGSGRDAAKLVAFYQRRRIRIEEIIISMPSASGRQMREALANCRNSGAACKTIPSVGELLSGKVLSSQIRDVSVVDLLGREPVRLEEGLIQSSIAGRAILITGAAGSIGSELCRQVARFCPLRLVLFEQAESELFRIDRELAQSFSALEIVPEIGDVREYARVDEVIRKHAIDSVFHAAAYKHVPMMENNVIEAVANNVIGTYNVARAADRNGVANLLMISSDKAVNPTNVMGATKRVAELIVSSMHSLGDTGHTKSVSVRFGNVLGSNGSVVPLFTEQIAAGGPVTVTHSDMRRYFMTIPEAVQLVLQASTMGKGSEIFVLDMGEPVRIVDLARNMIRLAGREPDVDIEIRYVGLRPGEKLYEELITKGENVQPTHHEKIKIFAGARMTRAATEDWVRQLERLIARRDESGIVEHLVDLVPEYTPSGKWQLSRRTQQLDQEKAAAV
jgi:FlaA1/EpsC-like NDP-sugar epimerase